MTVLYVTEQGALLSKKDGRIVVTKGNQTLADIPIVHVNQIVAFGNIHLTTPLVAHCLREKVDVCYLSQLGTYRGRLMPETTRDVRLRQQQYRLCGMPDFSLNTSKSIVAGKIHNQLAFCHRRMRNKKPLQEMISSLTSLHQQVQSSVDLDTLRGIEGAAANICLHVFAQSLKYDLSFSGRRDRPARDPINAMLNLGYTLLYNNMFAALNIVGFDPYMGCFHQPKHGHAALASDLIEEFRSVIVDTLVVLMVNHKEVTAEDFRCQSNGEVRFTDHSLRPFLDRYDHRLNTQVFYDPMKARFTYRQIFELQARQFAHLVMGAEKEYTPYLWDW